MPGFDPLNYDEPASSDFTLLYLLTGIALATYMMAKFAQTNNQLKYDDRIARVISTVLTYMANLLHTKTGDLEIDSKGKVFAIGPHRTGLDAVVVATKFKGTPPRFLATNMFNRLPGMASVLNRFKVIIVDANPSDRAASKARILEEASKTLEEKGCVALFPQGNFARLGQEPPRIYTGIAEIAIANKVPIHVIRLDGFWCLQNPFIPICVRNHTVYRSFLSLAHPNNIRTTLCPIIDYHLQPENANASEADKITEICAQLYAYYKYTEELNANQIGCIKKEISDKTHLTIWNQRLEMDNLKKRNRHPGVEVPTLTAMKTFT